MLKKIVSLFIIIFTLTPILLKNNELDDITYNEVNSTNSNYGSNIETPFEMNHHITTYLDTNTGYLYIAGDNRYYNLGTGNTTAASLYFPAYKNGDESNKFIDPIHWDFEIYHSAIIDSDGSLWVSGNASNGMLGPNISSTQKYFTQIETPNNKKAKKVVVSRGYATLLILEDDTSWVCGSTSSLSVSGSTTNWVQIDTLLPSDDNKVTQFQGGEYGSLILTQKGNLYTVGTTTSVIGGSSSWTTPKLTNVCQIDLMYTSSYALKNDGTIWTTGSNSYGQLGHNDKSTKSTFTQVNLELLENEFPVLVKGGIYTGVFLTNLGNLYFSGSDSDGQYGDGTINSTSSVFKLIHNNVSYFDVGEYQTGVLFNDSSLKFFGKNDFGQLGIGTTKNVYDALSDEAKLVSPIAEGLGSGLIPAVTLATYTANLNIWPSEYVENLSNEETQEYKTPVEPIRPGQEHEDGTSNTFIADDGGVYIFSSPAVVNSKNETIESIEYSTDSIKVFYEDLNLDDGILKDYTVNISITNFDNSFSSSFNYKTEQRSITNYPLNVGEYTVTTNLLNKNNELKTTTTTTFEITKKLFTPSLISTNLKDSIEDLYIIKDSNNIDSFKTTIMNGIKNSTFFSGEFMSIVNQEYITDNFSNLNSDNIEILFSKYNSNTYINEITNIGDYTAHIKIEPDNYYSNYISVNFTITADKLLTHSDVVLSSDNIIFNDSYTVSTNSSIIKDNQVLYIVFRKEDETFINEFEATDANLNNFSLYPKVAGNYIVQSVLKENNEIISIRESSYTINKKNAILNNNSSEYLQTDELSIDEIIKYYSKNTTLEIDGVIVSTTLNVVDNTFVVENNNYKYIITNSKNEIVDSINTTDSYTINISLENENYNTNTVQLTFNIELNSFNPVVPIILGITLIFIVFGIVIIKKKIT